MTQYVPVVSMTLYGFNATPEECPKTGHRQVRSRQLHLKISFFKIIQLINSSLGNRLIISFTKS